VQRLAAASAQSADVMCATTISFQQHSNSDTNHTKRAAYSTFSQPQAQSSSTLAQYLQFCALIEAP
jgi:hypothetical protein